MQNLSIKDITSLAIPLSVASAIAMMSHSTLANEPENEKPATPEEIIVTGVFSKSSIEGASVAISTIDEEELRLKVAVSAADMLKDVPGVFVNSSLGEVRNIVYSRGVSANSLDAGDGYFYVSLQEDGLPVQNAQTVNFGPDYFLRPDLMTKRVEAVRGGSSVITGPNAPGGIFNYLSKTGLSDPGTQISTRVGSEGGGFGNPYYRADFYHGGSFSDAVHYAVGGFYRDSTGPRDPGYSMNHGGQIRANIVVEYDQGTLQLNYKNLNDHNLWDEFIPVVGLSNAKPIGQFDYDSSIQPPRRPHGAAGLDANFSAGTLRGTDYWDPADGIHNTSNVFGFSWDHDIGNGLSFNNKLSYSKNHSNWNTGAGIVSLTLDDPGIYTGVLAVVDGNQTPLTGTLVFSDINTGEEMARVDSDGAGNYTILSNSLPDAPEFPNAILRQTAFTPEIDSKEVIDQFTITKVMDNMSLTLGGFYSFSDTSWHHSDVGVGLGKFTPNGDLVAVAIERENGTMQQVTSPDGFAGYGRMGGLVQVANRSEQEQLSIFFGHDWQINNQFNLNWGVRHEDFTVEGSNQFGSQITDDLGGPDGDPNTLYDNTSQTLGYPIRFKRDYNYTAFSGAVSYQWSDRQSTYTRYSAGKKAPNLAAFIGNSNPEDLQLIPQKITQLEVGHRVYGKNYSLSLTPFLTMLEDVGGFGNVVHFTDIDGTNYLPGATPLSSLETIGVEIESDVDISVDFNLRVSATIQDSKSLDKAIWNDGGADGRADDFIERIPDSKSANTADLQFAVTGTYNYSNDVQFFATWRHLGDRPANDRGSFDLESFNTLDVGGSYSPSDQWRFNLNINNLSDEHGVMSWQGTGLSGLDRNVAPQNELWSVVQQQPRSIFLTMSYSFD